MLSTSTRVAIPLRLPERLSALPKLANNLYWSWNPSVRAVWERIGGHAAWEESGHNPVRLLRTTPAARWQELVTDTSFLKRLDTASAALETYLSGETWWDTNKPSDIPDDYRIAYFSAEFGIAECLPIYSGGLGVLSGDHCKASSDLGIPLTAVGFLYRKGYFRQDIDNNGWQVENYPPVHPEDLPLRDTGHTIDVTLPYRSVRCRVWIADVGRIQLVLLDTFVPENNESDKWIAGNLYGGNQETRIQQELLLGVGGLRALDVLGLRPTVCHMNEGHSAFLALERIRQGVQEHQWPSDLSATISKSGNVFTTHTPVPAGFDVFPRSLFDHYLADAADQAGFDLNYVRGRGHHPSETDERFNMAVFAIRNAGFVNAVAELHGGVSREMARPGWPEHPVDEIPITSVTNGIHTRTFLSEEMLALWNSVDAFNDPAGLHRLDLGEIWRVRNATRRRLVEWTRTRLTKRAMRREADDIAAARHALDPDVLTIGFARRFATYKRGDLILRDRDRIKRLLAGPNPVQIVFAGKSHPKDDSGKRILQEIVRFTQEPGVRGKVVFLEDYDLEMARYLVQGVDIWLNTPRRPMEASGTSGMKAVINGALHCSVLDGWWAEAYHPDLGFSIGVGDMPDDHELADRREAEDLYALLERDIVPMFYDRGPDGVPEAWLKMVRESIAVLGPHFSTDRMVREYTQRAYVPNGQRYLKLIADNGAEGRSFLDWKNRVRAAWPDVKLVKGRLSEREVGLLEASVDVHLGDSIGAEDVTVSVIIGIETDGNLGADAVRSDVGSLVSTGNGWYRWTGQLAWTLAGPTGARFRMDPSREKAESPIELPLIRWD